MIFEKTNLIKKPKKSRKKITDPQFTQFFTKLGNQHRLNLCKKSESCLKVLMRVSIVSFLILSVIIIWILLSGIYINFAMLYVALMIPLVFLIRYMVQVRLRNSWQRRLLLYRK
jgi:hypothetical protein